jgi:hypothetical protein
MEDTIYLNEAFKQLQGLDEDIFEVTPEGGAELQKVVDADDTSLFIYDDEAETAEDLKETYIGDVILNCVVCDSKVYKKPEEVIMSETEIDEDGGEIKLANVGDTCPYCQSSDGFEVIGQVEEYCPNCDKETDEVKVEVENKEEIDESKKNKKIMFGKNRCYEELMLYVTLDDYTPWSGAVDTWDKIQEKGLVDALESTLEDIYPDGLTMTELNDILWFEQDWLEGALGVKFNEDEEDEEELDESLKQGKSLREEIENVTVETKDQIINVSAEEKDKDAEAVSDEEVLGELESETEYKFKEVDVDEFDEESFDDLNERYLKNIYENVKSYKTTSIKQRGNNKLFIEGLISFKSGKKAKTNYVFEAHSISKDNKLKFYGMNEQFAKGSKAFALRGALNGNKFMCESLTCKYTAKDGKTGETKLVYKTINK